MPKVHELKTHPVHFKQVKDGRKKTEIRFNDRDFKVGDELLLKEYDPNKKTPGAVEGSGVKGWWTDQICHRRITHVLKDFEGLAPGWVALSIEKL